MLPNKNRLALAPLHLPPLLEGEGGAEHWAHRRAPLRIGFSRVVGREARGWGGRAVACKIPQPNLPLKAWDGLAKPLNRQADAGIIDYQQDVKHQ
jgi:hypothetical protein